ncbi:2Fe-2S iron-sulfur cluster-binding protein [Cupriavidus basilensis]
MSGHWPATKIHFESFNRGRRGARGRQAVRCCAEQYRTALRGSGGHASILNVLRQHGCEVPSSCESGTCGTCRTTLVAGEADHRDMVLMPEELEGQVMICVLACEKRRTPVIEL